MNSYGGMLRNGFVTTSLTHLTYHIITVQHTVQLEFTRQLLLLVCFCACVCLEGRRNSTSLSQYCHFSLRVSFEGVRVVQVTAHLLVADLLST